MGERTGRERAALAADEGACEVRQMVPGVSEGAFQRVAELQGVAVLAEHQRNDQPVVGRAHTAVGADHAVKGPVRPTGDVRRRPHVGRGVVQLHFRRVVRHVVHGDALPGLKRRDGLAHRHAVQGHDAAHGHGLAGELVLGGHVGHKPDIPPGGLDGFALRQIAQGHNEIVFGIDTKDSVHVRILLGGESARHGPNAASAHGRARRSARAKKRKAGSRIRLSVYNILK